MSAPGTATATLAICGVVAGLVAYLKGGVAPVGDAPLQARYEWPSPLDDQVLMQIPLRPEPAKPGELLKVTKSDGSEVEWIVPEGVKGGDVIHFDTMKKLQPKRLLVTLKTDASSGTTLSVKCPNGTVVVMELDRDYAAGEEVTLEQFVWEVAGFTVDQDLIFLVLPYAAAFELFLFVWVLCCCCKRSVPNGKAEATQEAPGSAPAPKASVPPTSSVAAAPKVSPAASPAVAPKASPKDAPPSPKAKASPEAAAEAAPEEAPQAVAVTEAAPVKATEAAPVEATEAAPVEAAEAAPVEATEAAPVEATEAAPVEAAEAAPAEATEVPSSTLGSNTEADAVSQQSKARSVEGGDDTRKQ